MTNEIEILPTREELAPTLRDVVREVALERKYLMTVTGFSIDETRTFLQKFQDGGGVQFVAMTGDRAVGWCDVVRCTDEGTQHCGRLGMGLAPGFRGQGLGRKLIEKTLEAARREGIERVELEVFSPNLRAIKLYERVGFDHEGCKRRARILDGIEGDILLMARFL